MDFDNALNRVGTACVKWDSDSRYQDGTVLPMWVADMDFQAPDEVARALQKRSEHPVYGYTFDNGDFQRVTVDWIEKRFHWQVCGNWIAFTPSVLTSLALTIHCVTEPEDKVVVMEPVYHPFAHFVKNNGRQVEVCPLLLKDGCYSIDFERLEACTASPDVKLLILCNPHNPVGRVYTRDELWRIGEICLKNQVKIFSDEIHADLTMPGYQHIPIAGISEEIAQITVTAYSISKIFNLAGLHSSSAIIPNENVRERFLKQREAWGVENINCFAYEAYKAAYRDGEPYVQQLQAYLAANRDFAEDYFAKHLPEITVSKLEGTYLMWLDCSGLGKNDEELDTFFLEQAGLCLNSGYLFGQGGSRHMRMNIACTRAVLKAALDRLKAAVQAERGGAEHG